MAESLNTTVIGDSIFINGNLQGNEDLIVYGRIEGTIELSSTLNVESNGIVKADVSVKNAIVSGVVVGNIIASDSVEITEDGRMVGDIKAPRIIILEGARFRGNIDMGDLDAPRPLQPLSRISRPMSSFSQNTQRTAQLPSSRPASTPTPAPAAAKPVEKPADDDKTQVSVQAPVEKTPEPKKAPGKPGGAVPAGAKVKKKGKKG